MRHNSYPKEYLEMFQRAAEESVVLHFSTHEKAIAFRSEMYKFRYAVRDALPESREIYDLVMGIRMSIKAKTLTFIPKKTTFLEQIND